MTMELRSQLKIEAQLSLQTVIDNLHAFVNRVKDWAGDTTVSISHCFIPGQDTECG